MTTSTTPKKTTAKKTTPKKAAPKKAASQATAKTTGLVAPHPAAEVAVTGALKPRVLAHWARFTIQDGRSVALAACSGKPAKSYSYGFAKTRGVALCRKCFGGDQS